MNDVYRFVCNSLLNGAVLLVLIQMVVIQVSAQEVEIKLSGHISNVSDLIDPQDAPTKNYVDQVAFNFGISMEQAGIVHLLNSGYYPLDIIQTGAPKDSLYGRRYQGGFIFYLGDTDTLVGVKGFVAIWMATGDHVLTTKTEPFWIKTGQGILRSPK